MPFFLFPSMIFSLLQILANEIEHLSNLNKMFGQEQFDTV